MKRQDGQDAAECGQEAAKRRPECGRISIWPRVPPPLYRFLTEIFAGCPVGLAAGAGGLGSLGPLAVHPWGQEFLYAAMYTSGLAPKCSSHIILMPPGQGKDVRGGWGEFSPGSHIFSPSPKLF